MNPQRRSSTLLIAAGLLSGCVALGSSNVFLNQTGVAPSGAPATNSVSVQIGRYSASTGFSIGTLFTVSTPAGQPTSLRNVAGLLGDAAIEGIVGKADDTTRDDSVFEMV